MQNSPDQKRLIVAVVLSLGVLLGWGYFFPAPKAPPPVVNATASNTTQAQSSPAEQFAAPVTPEPVKTVTGTPVVVQSPLYKAVFNSAGGWCSTFQLHRYQVSIADGAPDVDLVAQGASAAHPMGVLLSKYPTWDVFSWGPALGADGQPVSELNLADGKNATLSFVGEAAGIRLKRTLTFDPSTYYIAESLTIHNVSEDAKQVGDVRFTMAVLPFTADGDSYNVTRVAAYDDEGFKEDQDKDDLREKGFQRDLGVRWGGIISNYFMAVVAPVDPSAPGQFLAKIEDGIFRTTLSKPADQLAPGAETTLQMGYYLGPKDPVYLNELPGNLAAAIDYGFFSVIAKPLLVALNYFYSLVGNYGVAIILLTVCVKILFWPLSAKSYKSMEQMKKLQPMMAKIREKHGDDRQKMNEEMMSLYKTYKVNPAGGCLPMLLQIPVFIGLYQALLGAIQLRHAPFISHVPFTDLVWLADLSAKDPYYVTPLVMGATMFLQQKLSPPPGDPTQAKIMMLMPVIFTFMFLNFPAGLVVYWLVNNVLSIAQQKWMLRNA
ncbi:membrane protein insertase YidC [Megalodesulfovibrio gigas]|uniref:Membrane protein insertase YidC n=1 Tax=Megalodesulfovibrio gigas (strain ATCC 19364 / DSM 1382 / NCIMB 9332 / VKM B-1759) TaxID=1121448 RepID=T2GDQ8_MEGG1|nr:membrane protein insertase YidC [Megalodesulfovibrio gigas]AGW14710.1 putative YidC/Oxa1 family membrane protein insertase [Megalodesulfovibrio gigas DSM 1382 = ATCC 19364]